MQAPATLTATPPPAVLEFQPLDPRAIKLWRVSEQIAAAVVMIPSLIGVLISSYLMPRMAVPMIAGWGFLTSLWLWHSLWYPPRYYQAWGYRIDEHVLETRRGRVFQTTRLLPLNRLQHVDLQQGPLERLFGLAHLELHTAGTQNASITIPGLAHEEAARLRDHLVALGGTDGI
ncbi:MAG TPA: PH domain-containing protein [Blastocatellia bacterium]|nr:PH domain-containing protein [Blastocatellia bacterium]